MSIVGLILMGWVAWVNFIREQARDHREAVPHELP